MKIRNSLLLLSLTGAGLLITASGCEDSAAADRADTQQEILDAARTLEELDAVGVDPDDPDRYGEELRSLADQLGALMSAAEGGQREAVAMLAANANRRLAEHLLSRIAELESRQRLDRGRLHSAAKAVIVLDGLAASQQRIDLNEGQQTLERQAETYRERREEHQSSLSEIERPIEELRAVIDARQDEASRLRQREDNLLREAMEQGPADGFEQFQEAIELRRQADRLEIEIARREIQLHERQLEYEIVQKRRSAADQAVEAISASRDRLMEYVSTMHEAGAETQQDVETMHRRAADALESLEQRMDGTLDELYSEAQERIEEAASRIQQAGRDPAVQLAAARINQVRARVHAVRVHALRQHAAALDTLSEVQQTFSDLDISGRLDQARAAAGEAAGQAVEALNEARQTLANLPDADQPRIARTIENIEAIINSLQDEPGGSDGADGDAGEAGGVER